VGSATWIKLRHNVLSYSYTIFWSNSLISKSFLIVSLIVFLGLPLPLVIWLSSIWSGLLTTESIGFLSTCPNHLSLFSTIFSTIGEGEEENGCWVEDGYFVLSSSSWDKKLSHGLWRNKIYRVLSCTSPLDFISHDYFRKKSNLEQLFLTCLVIHYLASQMDQDTQLKIYLIWNVLVCYKRQHSFLYILKPYS